MIYFLIPIYNEAPNLELLADNLKKTLPEEEKFYVFSDDGSSDNSVHLIKQFFKNEQFKCLGDGANHGPGHAFNTGFEWILDQSANEESVVVTLEADNTSDLSILPQMLGVANLGFDLVLASPYAQGGGFEKTSFIRKILSFFANMFFRSFFDVKVLTLSSFYRVYKIELLREMQANYNQIIVEPGFISMLEILLKAIGLEAKMLEVPMVLHFSKRRGKSKMKLMKTIISYLRFFTASKKVLQKKASIKKGVTPVLNEVS